MSPLPLQNPTIPDDVTLCKIVPRLPIKSFHRFRSVCRNWNSFISSPTFAKLHRLVSSSNPKFLVRHCPSNIFYSLFYDEFNDLANLKELVELNRFETYLGGGNVVGFDNGLVCIHAPYTPWRDFCFLWNPAMPWSTHRQVLLQQYNVAIQFRGFCYVSVDDDYKIIIASSPGESNNLVIYSLNNGRWRQLNCPLNDHIDHIEDVNWYYRHNNYGVCVDDTLYWIDPFLNGFDFTTEKLSRFPLMDCVSEYRDVSSYVIKGCLALHCYRELRFSNTASSDVWILKKQQQGGESCCDWVKLFTLSAQYFARPYHVCNFTSSGKCLVYNKAIEEFKLLDVNRSNDDDDELAHSCGLKFKRDLSNYVWQLVETLNCCS